MALIEPPTCEPCTLRCAQKYHTDGQSEFHGLENGLVNIKHFAKTIIPHIRTSILSQETATMVEFRLGTKTLGCQ